MTERERERERERELMRPQELTERLSLISIMYCIDVNERIE